MFCEKCGIEINDNEKLCISCSGKILDEEQSANSVSEKIDSDIEDKNINTSKKSFGMLMGILTIAVILIIALTRNTIIDLNKYIITSTSGYSGYGEAHIEIDWERLGNDYGHKIKFTSDAKNEFGLFMNYVTPLDVMKDKIDVYFVDKKDKISNGDIIKYEFSIDDNLKRYIKSEVKFKNSEFVVNNMPDIETFDAFKDLKVEFVGVEPEGKINLQYTGSDMDVKYFSYKKNDKVGFSNGDKVIVEITSEKINNIIDEYGKAPLEYEKTFEVKGLNRYLSKFENISQDSLEKIKKQTKDSFIAERASSLDLKGETIEDFQYVGNYLLTLKEPNSWLKKNILFVINKVKVNLEFTQNGETFKDFKEFYWCIKYPEIIINPDGDIVNDITQYEKSNSSLIIVDSGVSDGWWSSYKWYYNGYENLDALFKDNIANKLNEYFYEDNIIE